MSAGAVAPIRGPIAGTTAAVEAVRFRQAPWRHRRAAWIAAAMLPAVVVTARAEAEAPSPASVSGLTGLLVHEAPAPAAGHAAAVEESERGFRWIGQDGKPLPFASVQELLGFLDDAAVVKIEPTEHGINRPDRFTLERDGVRMRAAFRTVEDEFRNRIGPGGRYFRIFRDHYAFEVAAYKLAELLDYHHVPPTVLRTHEGRRGSLQAWVEHGTLDRDRIENHLRPPDLLAWSRQQLDEQTFDALINNHDRNAGNAIIDQDWKLWLIDHGRCFLIDHGKERIQTMTRIRRHFHDGLRQLDEPTIKEHLAPYLGKIELRELLRRRKLILERIEELVAERGEETVLLD